MKYKSTRGGERGVSFLEVLLQGMASDGGLYVPERIPQPDAETWTRWVDLDYCSLCFEVFRLYISESEISSVELKHMIREAYACFRVSETVALTEPLAATGVRVLELFHGPSFAFKDVALQLLGRLFEFALQKKKNKKNISARMTVLGATSGDTGGAALAGVAHRPGVNCVILYPVGRTSEIQELQMRAFNCREARNVFACAVENSTFDDCQAMVKQLFADKQLNEALRLGAVNSINWARILAQIVYFVYACGQVVRDSDAGTDGVVFAVPTGNFGDVLAGYYAKRMRLPIEKLVVGCNVNEVLPQFFNTGEYRVAETVHATLSPSMDIAVSSNFERYLYYLLDEDGARVAEKFKQLQTAKRHFTVTREELEQTKQDFVAYSVNEAETLNTMAQVYASTTAVAVRGGSPRRSFERVSLMNDEHSSSPREYLLCPHSAVGFRAALNFKKDYPKSSAVVVSLATAHIGKFVDSVLGVCDLASMPDFRAALERAVPPELARLRDRPGPRILLKNEADAVAQFLVDKFGGKSHQSSLAKRRTRLLWLSVSTVAVAATAVAVVAWLRR